MAVTHRPALRIAVAHIGDDLEVGIRALIWISGEYLANGFICPSSRGFDDCSFQEIRAVQPGTWRSSGRWTTG